MTSNPVLVHVWMIGPDLQIPGKTPGFFDILSVAEKNRATGFAIPELRARFIRRRLILRLVLGDSLDIPPANISILVDDNGKPFLDPGRPCFSLSASADWVAVALTNNRPVGIDIEEHRKIPDALKVAEPFFHPDETASLLHTELDARDAAFLTCWTRKEAVLKAHGAGLSAGLKSVNVGFSRFQKEGSVVLLENREFVLQDVDMKHGAVAAIAVEGGNFTIVPEALPSF